MLTSLESKPVEMYMGPFCMLNILVFLFPGVERSHVQWLRNLIENGFKAVKCMRAKENALPKGYTKQKHDN